MTTGRINQVFTAGHCHCKNGAMFQLIMVHKSLCINICTLPTKMLCVHIPYAQHPSFNNFTCSLHGNYTRRMIDAQAPKCQFHFAAPPRYQNSPKNVCWQCRLQGIWCHAPRGLKKSGLHKFVVSGPGPVSKRIFWQPSSKKKIEHALLKHFSLKPICAKRGRSKPR